LNKKLKIIKKAVVFFLITFFGTNFHAFPKPSEAEINILLDGFSVVSVKKDKVG
jgi:hypothetical protein